MASRRLVGPRIIAFTVALTIVGATFLVIALALPSAPAPCDPDPDAAYANASGSALGVLVTGDLTGAPIRLGEASASQTGPGSKEDGGVHASTTISSPVAGFDVLVSVEHVSTGVEASVAPHPDGSHHRTTVALANMSLLDGLVTATTVESVAEARANATWATHAAQGTVLQGVHVNGTAVASTDPWTYVDLSSTYGPGSHVTVNERIGSVHAPRKPLHDGYAADATTRGIHVVLTDALPGVPGAQGVEIIVSEARAHADFPEVPTCTDTIQSLTAHGLVLEGRNDVAFDPVHTGFALAPPLGGEATNHLAHTEVEGHEVNGGTAWAWGETAGNATRSAAHAHVSDLCLLPHGSSCLLSASTVTSKVEAEASADAAAAATGGARLVDLHVAGNPVCPDVVEGVACEVPPNTRIEVDGVGVVILNEHLTSDTDPTDCVTDLTVRAVHVTTTRDDVDVVAAESHAGARHCPNPAYGESEEPTMVQEVAADVVARVGERAGRVAGVLPVG